jgi:hypothetical protein
MDAIFNNNDDKEKKGPNTKLESKISAKPTVVDENEDYNFDEDDLAAFL